MEHAKLLEFKVDISMDTLEKLKEAAEKFVKDIETEITVAEDLEYQPNIDFFSEDAYDGSESAIVIQLS